MLIKYENSHSFTSLWVSSLNAAMPANTPIARPVVDNIARCIVLSGIIIFITGAAAGKEIVFSPVQLFTFTISILRLYESNEDVISF